MISDDRLPFLLPDYTRFIWHSANARDVWGPRIAEINQAWLEVEREAVVRGRRDSCLTFVGPEHLPSITKWAGDRELVVLPLAQNGQANQYSSTGVSMQAGKPWQYRVALTRPDLIPDWMQAWHGAAGILNPMIGRLLGYPHCCREFFERVWVQNQCIDTTFDMAARTFSAFADQKAQTFTIPADVPHVNNILLRWLGVRLVPHLPCSFLCTATERNARQYLELLHELHPAAGEWVEDMLRWPAEWSARHGIGEIRTPVLTISTRTDATRGTRTVRYMGQAYPDEGARGLKFPFRISTGNVTEKASFQRAHVPVHELNGFGSADAMRRAHDVLLKLLRDASVGAGASTLLDLGCGTGELLVRAQRQGWRGVSGVESDATRAGAGNLPIVRGDIFNTSLWDKQWDVIMLMPGRLLEGDLAQAAVLRDAVLSRAKFVLLYAYGDWLTRFGGIGPLCAEAGLGHGEVVGQGSGEGVAAVLCSFASVGVQQHDDAIQ